MRNAHPVKFAYRGDDRGKSRYRLTNLDPGSPGDQPSEAAGTEVASTEAADTESGQDEARSAVCCRREIPQFEQMAARRSCQRLDLDIDALG